MEKANPELGAEALRAVRFRHLMVFSLVFLSSFILCLRVLHFALVKFNPRSLVLCSSILTDC